MIRSSEREGVVQDGAPDVSERHWVPLPEATKGRVLLVEDEEIIRDTIGPLLEDAGYQVSFAENGREALRKLYSEKLPHLIVLDLRMPVMDGWQFRTIQKDDPKLSGIPVLAFSADGSAQSAAISAEAYLRKPADADEFLATVERVLIEKERQLSAQADEAERLTALGRLAAGVGHEINNPLAFLLMNLDQSLEKLRAATRALGGAPTPSLSGAALDDLKANLGGVTDMLEDCQIGGERIRETVGNLQRLARRGDERRGPVDVQKIMEQSVSVARNQIRHRARLVRSFAELPPIKGNGSALGQVFLNLLVNAADAIPEGDADGNQIRIAMGVEAHEGVSEVVVEIGDSGKGIAPEDVSRVFDPFFTTKPPGQGTGLGLSISREVVREHGGRMTVESVPGQGSIFRVFLPIGDLPAARAVSRPARATPLPVRRGRILVVDDEPLIGRVMGNALREDHDVHVVDRAGEAVARFERGETFDLMIVDVVMPDLSGPEFYALIAERWPAMVPRLVFMTGGAFTPETVEFTERVPIRVLSKPFKVDRLKRLVRERLRDNT